MSVLPTTKKKASGLLRYVFGEPSAFARGFTPQFGPITFGPPAAFAQIVILGHDSEVTPDADNQVFGASCGHPSVVFLPGTLFSASLLNQPTDIIGQTTGVNANGNQSANSYIPAGTKFAAWFQAFDAVFPNGATSVLVQSDVIQNRPFRGVTGAAVQDPLAPGTGVEPSPGEFLGAIRVAVRNQGAQAPGPISGILYCRLEHSNSDIPGVENQSGINLSA